MADNQDYNDVDNGESQENLQLNNGDQNFSDGTGENGGIGDAGATVTNTGSAEKPGENDDRKLFVGGLTWSTTESHLRDYFTKFGDIESISLKIDTATGRSRGFAFIVFAHAESIDKVLCAGEHIVDSKKVDPKRAKTRTGKIFVGGLPEAITEDELKEFFSNFGAISLIEMPFDKQRNMKKSFCFITFESDKVVGTVLQQPKMTIKGKDVDVKKATPKPDAMNLRGGGGRGFRGGRGMNRGRGRGGGFASGGTYGYDNSYYSGYNNYSQHGPYSYNTYDYELTTYGPTSGYNYAAGNVKQRGTKRHQPY